MPKVKTSDGKMKEFPYTKDGIAAAKAYAKAKDGKMMMGGGKKKAGSKKGGY